MSFDFFSTCGILKLFFASIFFLIFLFIISTNNFPTATMGQCNIDPEELRSRFAGKSKPTKENEQSKSKVYVHLPSDFHNYSGVGCRLDAGQTLRETYFRAGAGKICKLFKHRPGKAGCCFFSANVIKIEFVHSYVVAIFFKYVCSINFSILQTHL